MHRWLPQIVLWISALGFGYFGVRFLVDPAGYASWVDIAADTPVARTELRAMYGGLELAIAVFFATCAQRREWWRVGLFLSALACLGLGSARAVGLAVEGVAPLLMRLFLATELILASASLFAMRYTPR